MVHLKSYHPGLTSSLAWLTPGAKVCSLCSWQVPSNISVLPADSFLLLTASCLVLSKPYTDLMSSSWPISPVPSAIWCLPLSFTFHPLQRTFDGAVFPGSSVLIHPSATIYALNCVPWLPLACWVLSSGGMWHFILVSTSWIFSCLMGPFSIHSALSKCQWVPPASVFSLTLHSPLTMLLFYHLYSPVTHDRCGMSCLCVAFIGGWIKLFGSMVQQSKAKPEIKQR